MTERTRDGVLHEQDGSGNLIPQTFSRERREGEDANLDRVWGGAKVTSTRYTAATAGNQLVTGAGVFYGVKITTIGTSTTVVIYDNTAASGRKLIDISSPANGDYTPARGAKGSAPSVAVPFTNGLHVVIGGTGSPDVEVDYLAA